MSGIYRKKVELSNDPEAREQIYFRMAYLWEEMLQNVAKSYESQTEMRITALTSLLEPIMIVAMGGGVAFIVFSILMPIMQLNTFVPK